jgi:hypothetical protein
MDYSVVTVQRTGSHYLVELIFQYTGIQIKKYHEPQDGKMITIVRDPRDTVCSQLTMELLHKDKIETIDYINHLVEYNACLYESLLDADIIIDYNDLINYPYETTKAMLDIMELKMNDAVYLNRLIDREQDNYWVSSKVSKDYKQVQDIVDTVDLSRMIEVCNKMLLKAIKVKL